ncbi:glycosyltransferase family 4 protein [Maribellus mangrovi]|uniref:glycosyltransferase family 4 protein n=1 Tax=Maribellus mangrovi TaxID=3133146 RepID=UPI0030EBED14
MKIVFLVASYMPHQIVSIRALLDNYDVEIHSFSVSKNYTYVPGNIEGLVTYPPGQFHSDKLYTEILKINPKLVVVAGWFIKDFVNVSKKIRKELDIPVVSYSDTQWTGSIKQKINTIISPWFLKKTFSHIWVAGIYQYEYARKLGFRKEKILYNGLSCDVKLFNKVSTEKKRKEYPKKFIFVGRFVEVKGLDNLLNAWRQIKDKRGWKLSMIGDGPLKEQFLNDNSIIVNDFMPHNELIQEMQNSGCFILPSVFEPWALVIHEAVAAGLPVIATTICGATPHFVINNWNGYSINTEVQNLKEAMQKIMLADSKQLYDFSIHSKRIAENITPEIGAANLMSIVL